MGIQSRGTREIYVIAKVYSSTVVAQTHPLSGLISRSIHQRSTQIKRFVITAPGRTPGNTPLCQVTLNGITRMNNNVCLPVLATELILKEE